MEAFANAASNEAPDHGSDCGVGPAVLHLVYSVDAAGNDDRVRAGSRRREKARRAANVLLDQSGRLAFGGHLHSADHCRQRQRGIGYQYDVDCSRTITAMYPAAISRWFPCFHRIGHSDRAETLDPDFSGRLAGFDQLLHRHCCHETDKR